MDNILKQINKNTIKLTVKGKSKTYHKVIPGVSDFTIKDLNSYIKYKGEHYA
tara:strand:+ start:400 stop:555 length:156 start_codon:yes stop_codon:yes gene_type:complete